MLDVGCWTLDVGRWMFTRRLEKFGLARTLAPPWTHNTRRTPQPLPTRSLAHLHARPFSPLPPFPFSIGTRRLRRQPFPQHFQILLHLGDHGPALAVVVFMMLRYGAGESCGLEPFEKRLLHHAIAQWNPTLPPAVVRPLPEEILHENRGEVALHETCLNRVG